MFSRINAFLKEMRRPPMKLLSLIRSFSPPAQTPWHITSEILLSKDPRYSKYSIGRFSYGFDPKIIEFMNPGNLNIGSFCCLASDVTILLGGEHNPNWVTTYNFDLIYDKFRDNVKRSWTKGDVIIGTDVWIGQGAFILSGVKIGDGAVIGACSVVAKDVPPYSIVAGNPAREIRKRFDDDTIAKLLKIKWWNWDIERIKENLPFLLSNNVKEFVDKNC